MARVNLQCQNQECGLPYGVQCPDGIGDIRVRITCVCGYLIDWEISVPPREGDTILVVARETISSDDKFGG